MKPLVLPFRQVHLDFHTSEQIVGIGAQFDAEAFAATLKAAHVNSVTCFSRCHHGLIYHDTQFEAKHPHLEVDLLGEQIRACHEAGIRVPIYITVGWDEFQAARHPEWREVAPDGRLRGAGPLEAGWKPLCFNTPYLDYVVAQTEEVLATFDVDGLFFDILQQGQCLCGACLASMAEDGADPESEGDRRRHAAAVLARTKQRLTDAARALNANCTLFYNSGHVGPGVRDTLQNYTHLELESLPSGGWGYDHFPTTARYARNLGVDFLGMTGKFHKSWADFGGFKDRAALEYECFTALAEGGKCSIGDQLHPTGALSPATYDLIGGVYAQVEAMEPWCAGARPVTEIAILTPEAFGQDDGRVDSSAGGAYRMLLEDHYQFDIVDARMSWDRYRAVILPDKIAITDDLQRKVEEFLASDGVVVLSGASGLDPAGERFVLTGMPVVYQGPARFSPDYVVPAESVRDGIPVTEHVMYEPGLHVELASGAEQLGEVWDPYFDRTYAHFCSHRHAPAEGPSGLPAAARNGNILYFAHPIFAAYLKHGPRFYRQWFLNCLRALLPEKLVRTNAPTTAHLTLSHQAEQGRSVLHLLHYVPERRYGAIATVEDVIPLHDVQVSIEWPRVPTKVYLAQDSMFLPFRYDGGRVEVALSRIDGHALLVIE